MAGVLAANEREQLASELIYLVAVARCVAGIKDRHIVRYRVNILIVLRIPDLEIDLHLADEVVGDEA